MPLPALNDWERTKNGLHRAAQVLSAFRKAYVQPEPNALHLALFVSSDGLTTGATAAGEFTLDFGKGEMIHIAPDGTQTRVSIQGQSQIELAQTLIQSAERTGAQKQQEFKPPTGEEALYIDKADGIAYARALYTIYTAVARFKARRFGTMSPAVVWGHGFDLSTLWFKGHDPDEHSQPHLNFGFSPGSEGLPRPYFYTYAWPLPDGLLDETLSEPARWYQAGWTGAMIAYDDLLDDSYPEQTIETLLEQIFALMSTKL